MVQYPPPGPTQGTHPAKQQLERSSQLFLQEIGQLASEIQQRTTNPQVRQWIGQIQQCCDQIRANEQAEGQLENATPMGGH